jgi:hypothetical protein
VAYFVCHAKIYVTTFSYNLCKVCHSYFPRREHITVHYYVCEINIYQHHGSFPKYKKEGKKWQGRKV